MSDDFWRAAIHYPCMLCVLWEHDGPHTLDRRQTPVTLKDEHLNCGGVVSKNLAFGDTVPRTTIVDRMAPMRNENQATGTSSCVSSLQAYRQSPDGRHSTQSYHRICGTQDEMSACWNETRKKCDDILRAASEGFR